MDDVHGCTVIGNAHLAFLASTEYGYEADCNHPRAADSAAHCSADTFAGPCSAQPHCDNVRVDTDLTCGRPGEFESQECCVVYSKYTRSDPSLQSSFCMDTCVDSSYSYECAPGARLTAYAEFH